MASEAPLAPPAAPAPPAASAASAPGKPASAFRVYESSGSVHDHYAAMREHQSLAYSRRMTAFWRGGAAGGAVR